MGWFTDFLRRIANALDAWTGRDSDDASCSFCGAHRLQVQYLLSAPGRTYICEKCVEQSRSILEEHGLGRPSSDG